MTDRAGLTEAECDALIRADLDKYRPNRDRNLDPLIRLEHRGWVRAAYAAGQAAASVPQGEPVAWYTPLMGNYAHVVWGKRPDTPMEWAPLYAAPAVAQEKRNECGSAK